MSSFFFHFVKINNHSAKQPINQQLVNKLIQHQPINQPQSLNQQSPTTKRSHVIFILGGCFH